jgi:hypothetical protein
VFFGALSWFWIGYTIALIFVRIHWLIPVALIILGPMVLSFIASATGRDEIHVMMPLASLRAPSANIVAQSIQAFAYVALLGGIAAWLLVRRLPVRR